MPGFSHCDYPVVRITKIDRSVRARIAYWNRFDGEMQARTERVVAREEGLAEGRAIGLEEGGTEGLILGKAGGRT